MIDDQDEQEEYDDEDSGRWLNRKKRCERESVAP